MDFSPPQRRSSRSNSSVTVAPQMFPKPKTQKMPECPAKRFVEGCGSYDGQIIISHHVGGWVSPQYANIIDRTWPDRKDIYVPQVGDIVLYYPVGHRNFLERHPDIIGEKNRTRVPLWEIVEKEKQPDGTSWWNESWLHSVNADQAVYPLICRVTEAHFEFPPDDPFVMSYGADGSVVWGKKEKASGVKSRQNTSLRLSIALRPLTPVLPEALPLPPCFSVVWFPSDDAKPFLIPFQSTYMMYQSLSTGIIATAEETRVIVQGFATLNERSMRLDEYLSSLTALVQKMTLEEILEQEMATLSPEYRIATHELRLIFDLFQKKIEMSSSNQKLEKLTNNHEATIFSLIRSTLPLWEGVAVVPKSNKRVAMLLSPWEIQVKGSHSSLGVLESSTQELIEFIINRTVRDHADSHLFHDIVTDDEAPSYSSAVPISMATSKILNRLRCSYYRSINSILSDFNAILGNCLLYNSPAAPIVSQARSFVVTMQSNIKDAVAQSDIVHSSLGTIGIFSTFHLADPVKILYARPTNTSPYKGSLECQWMYNQKLWTPQAGDFVVYSKALHEFFLESHSCDLTDIQCRTVVVPNGDFDEIEAEVLWTKPCFPQQRRKHTLGTFREDTPIIELGLRFIDFPEDVTTVYWRPCILSDSGTSNCGCGCSAPFLRMANSAPNSGLSRSDIDNLSLIFAALKQKCLERTCPPMLDPKLTKKAVKEGCVPTNYPQTSTMESLSLGPPIKNASSRNQLLWNGLALYGFLPDSDETLQSRDPTLSAYSFPELCLDLVEHLLKNSHYRSRGSLQNDIVESFVSAVSTRLIRLSKIERGQISLKNIALCFAQNHGVSDEEKRFMEVVEPIRELHAAALASAAGVDCSLALFGSTNEETIPEIFEPDRTRNSARHALAALFSALSRDPALNFSDLRAVQKMTVKIYCAGKTVTHNKQVKIFPECIAKLADKTKNVKITCEGRPFTYECDLEEMDDDDGQLSVHEGSIKSVETNCVTFSNDELAKYQDAARFFFGQPGKLDACARCQVKCRSFFDCRVLRRHSNIDFDWKGTFESFGGINGLIGSLHPDREETATTSQVEKRTTTESEENHNESAACLQKTYQSCQELLEQARSIEAQVKRISELPVRLSKSFLQESFPVDPTDGRYIYCIICGMSGDLFCCDKCPNVFHSRCLGLENVPAGEWFCEECNSTNDSDPSYLPFGRSELDLNQLDQLDAKVTSLRSLRADRTNRQESDSAKRKDKDLDDIEQEVASEIETQSAQAPRRRGRPRKIISPGIASKSLVVTDLPRRRGRPRKTEQIENSQKISLISQETIQPSRQTKRGRPPRDRLTESNLQVTKRRRISRADRSHNSLPHQFAEELETENTLFTGENNGTLTRKSTRARSMPTVSREIRPSHQNSASAKISMRSKRGRSPKHERATALLQKQERPPKHEVVNEPKVQIQKRQRTSRVNNSNNGLRPHQFVEDLEIEDSTDTGAEYGILMTRRSARILR